MFPSPVILGLDFGGTKIAAAVCSLDGTRLGSATVGSGGELGARASFGRGVHAARDLLDSAARGATLAAVGVSTFGIPFEDRVDLAPAISGWGDLPLGRELRAAFPGAAIRMATDAKAAAQAEVRWGALADCDPAIYLNLGTGLSTALVIGGQVVAGADGAAGEIGYNLRALADVGLPLRARVPLEDMISGQALARRAPGAMEAADVFGAAASEPGLDRLVTDFVTELAFHVVNLAISVNPARIAVGGGLVRSWERLRPGLEAGPQGGHPVPARTRHRPLPRRRPADRRGGPGRRRGGSRHQRIPPRRSTPRRITPWRSTGRQRPDGHRPGRRRHRRRPGHPSFTITHRKASVMRRLKAIGALVAVGVLAAACSAGKGGGSGNSSGSTKATNTVTISNENGALWTCDFSPFNGSDTLLSVGFVYEPLVYVNPLQSGKTTPMLATSWKWGAGNKSLTFTIRQGRQVQRRDPDVGRGRGVHVQPAEEVPGPGPHRGLVGAVQRHPDRLGPGRR